MRRAALLLLFVACSAPVEIQLQPEEDARSLLLVVEGESGDLEINAFDEAALARPIRASGLLIHALFYERSLVELGLEAGALSIDPDGVALAPPDAIFRITLDGRERLEELPLALSMLRIRVRDPCVRFRSTYLQPGELGEGTRLVFDLEEQLLIVSTLGRWFSLEEGGTVRALEDAPMDVPLGAGWVDRDAEEIWLAGADGRTAHGSLERGFREGPPIPVARTGARMWLSGSERGEPFQLYAMTSSLAIYRLDDGASEWVALAPETRVGVSAESVSLARIGSSEAIATGAGPAEILEVDGDRVERVSVPVINELDVHDEVRIAAAIEGWGPLLGTRSGRLATRVDAGWSVLLVPETKAEVFVMVAFRGGVVFGGEDGVINQVYPEARLCEGAQVGFANDAPLLSLVELSGELYAFPRLQADVPLTVVQLTPL